MHQFEESLGTNRTKSKNSEKKTTYEPLEIQNEEEEKSKNKNNAAKIPEMKWFDCFNASDSYEKVDPKTHFANERTFLQYFGLAFTLFSFGFTLFSLDSQF